MSHERRQGNMDKVFLVLTNQAGRKVLQRTEEVARQEGVSTPQQSDSLKEVDRSLYRVIIII